MNNYSEINIDKDSAFLNSKYELAECIGSGNYGCVYKALCKETNQSVAIKKLFKPFDNLTLIKRK